tara:strand:+ start:423 stop:1004 length:582 start_codon:yes stop_codon:yes gene_type:complete
MAYGLRQTQKPGAGYQTAGFIELPVRLSVVTTGTVSFFNGDTVKYTVGAGATAFGIEIMDSPTTTNKSVGVVVGARWVDGSGTPQWGQNYPAGASNTDVMVFVAPAAGTVFQIQGTSVWNNNQIGNLNVVADGAGGSLKTGNSSKTLTNSSTNTVAGAVQIVDVLRDGSNETSATPNILVRFNPAAIAAVQLG